MAVKDLVPDKRGQSNVPVRRDGDAFDIFNNFGRFFESFFGDSRVPAQFNSDLNWSYNPRVDIKETDAAYELSAELAGLNEKDIEVNLDNGILKISGEKRSDKEEKDEGRNYYRRERSYGRFERSFRLPEGIKTDKVEARYKNGVLDVTVPKSETAKSSMRKVEVKAG